MGRFLDTLKNGSASHTVEPTEAGFVLVRTGDGFDNLAAKVVSRGGFDYVALPVLSEGDRYERVVIIPI